MDKSMESRIKSMARRDQLAAVIFTAVMWIVLLFAYFAIRPAVPTAGISIVLAVALLVLGSFNTASMLAMIKRYADQKDVIHREDILNLDKNRQQTDKSKREGGH